MTTSRPEPPTPARTPPPHRSRTVSISRKVGVLLVGIPLVGLGIAMLVLPGPGALVILAGLAILALEFPWAERLSNRVHDGIRTMWKNLTGRR